MTGGSEFVSVAENWRRRPSTELRQEPARLEHLLAVGSFQLDGHRARPREASGKGPNHKVVSMPSLTEPPGGA